MQSNGGLISAPSVSLVAAAEFAGVGRVMRWGLPMRRFIRMRCSCLQDGGVSGGFYVSNDQTVEITNIATRSGECGRDDDIGRHSSGWYPVRARRCGDADGSGEHCPDCSRKRGAGDYDDGIGDADGGGSIGDSSDGAASSSAGDQFVADSNVDLYIGGNNTTTLASGTLRECRSGGERDIRCQWI